MWCSSPAPSQSSAEGDLAPPVLIHPVDKRPTNESTNAWDESFEKNASEYKKQGLKTVHIAGGKSASMNADRWANYVRTVLAPQIKKTRKVGEWAVLLVDGLKAHVLGQEELLLEMLKDQIIIFVYEPNLTALLAPPDDSKWHGVFKTLWRRLLWDKDGVDGRVDFLAKAGSVMEAFTRVRARQAFEHCGLVPDSAARNAARDRVCADLGKKVKADQVLFRVVEAHPELAKYVKNQLLELRTQRREAKRAEQKEKEAARKAPPRSGFVNSPAASPLLRISLNQRNAAVEKKAEAGKMKRAADDEAHLKSRKRVVLSPKIGTLPSKVDAPLKSKGVVHGAGRGGRGSGSVLPQKKHVGKKQQKRPKPPNPPRPRPASPENPYSRDAFVYTH